MPYMNNNHIGFENLPSLISILETAFSDTDKVVTMERQLQNLRQANWDFSTYYIEFVNYVINTKWNEAAKR